MTDFNMGKIVESLLGRTEEHSWIPVLKALIVFHRLMRDGHEVSSASFSTLIVSGSRSTL